MATTALIVLSILAATVFTAVPQNRRITNNLGRIYGGSDAPDGEYPFQALLRTGDLTYCGGSIISNEWILTAASCALLFSNITVQVGSNQQSTAGTTYKVLQTIYHENFTDSSNSNKDDIAVMRVEPMTFTSKVQPIALDVKEIGANETCIISGWGKVNKQDDHTSENLQHFQVKTISIESCQEKWGQKKVGDGQICTLAEGRQGACTGDRGGPVTRKVNGKYEQLGVISWGYECAAFLPDVHTRVSAYSRWIRINCNNCV